MYSIDINCDLGEGMGYESQLMPFISSCNVACGGHFGDAGSMQAAALLAIQNGVLIGAHPSYPDRENFGRKSLHMPPAELGKSILAQIKALEEVLGALNAPLNHIKPHGALYNDLARNGDLAGVFLSAIQEYRDRAFLLVPFGSAVAQEALDRGFQIRYEAFADRNYNPDLSLVSRNRPQALITDPRAVLDHLLPMVIRGEVIAITGEAVSLKADTYCLHGDGDTILQIMAYLSEELPKHQIFINR